VALPEPDGFSATERLAGQVTEGASLSLTVTVNEQLDILPEASITLQVTVVTPTEKAEPEAGVHRTAPTPGQLSLTIGAL
jgi:hypothetical protein